jgi:hypothetical protein
MENEERELIGMSDCLPLSTVSPPLSLPNDFKCYILIRKTGLIDSLVEFVQLRGIIVSEQ